MKKYILIAILIIPNIFYGQNNTIKIKIDKKNRCESLIENLGDSNEFYKIDFYYTPVIKDLDGDNLDDVFGILKNRVSNFHSIFYFLSSQNVEIDTLTVNIINNSDLIDGEYGKENEIGNISYKKNNQEVLFSFNRRIDFDPITMNRVNLDLTFIYSIQATNFILKEYKIYDDLYSGHKYSETEVKHEIKTREYKKLVNEIITIDTFNLNSWIIENNVMEDGYNIDFSPIRKIKRKTYLYNDGVTKMKTKMYLIQNDKVFLIKEQDNWVYISYQNGKKVIEGWIKKSDVE